MIKATIKGYQPQINWKRKAGIKNSQISMRFLLRSRLMATGSPAFVSAVALSPSSVSVTCLDMIGFSLQLRFEFFLSPLRNLLERGGRFLRTCSPHQGSGTRKVRRYLS